MAASRIQQLSPKNTFPLSHLLQGLGHEKAIGECPSQWFFIVHVFGTVFIGMASQCMSLMKGIMLLMGLFIKIFMKDPNPRGHRFQGIMLQLNGPQQRISNVLSYLQYCWDQITSGIFLLAGLQRIVHVIMAILHSWKYKTM